MPTIVFVFYNDFNKNLIHIFLGYSLVGKYNYNNFLTNKYYSIYAQKRHDQDTINFKYNFWGKIEKISIFQQIHDISGREKERYHGPIIDYSDFKLERINWLGKMGNP